MTKSILLSFLFSLIAFTAYAQHLIKGDITDQYGEPLAGVNILLFQNQIGTSSQSDGSYQISVPSNLKVVTIEFRFIGYRTQAKTINLTADRTV